MNYKKALSAFLFATVLSTSGITAFANNEVELEKINAPEQTKEVIAIKEEAEEKQAYFGSFSGVVKEINDFGAIEGAKIALLEDAEGGIANIIISEDTYIVDGDEIAVGSTVTGFYKANAPMILIYPAQYNAEVVAVENKDQNIKVDLFDKDLVSADNSLKLNISEDTEVVTEDGKPFEGELANRKLVVTYDVSTRSIPAQTTPIKVVVLFEEAVPPIIEVPEEDTEIVEGDVSAMDMMVNDKKIEAPAAYTNKDGVVMVPLRAISEALEYEVKWNQEMQSVLVGKGISLKIGEDSYNYMKMTPIKLGAAPELVEGTTFVPLSFFREVMQMNNAYVFEGQIVINNGEKME